MQPPSSNTKRSLQIAKQLADFIPGCNPLDTNDLCQILREVGALRGNLRADAAEVEDYLCGLAERMVEMIERHGHIAGRQAFSIVVDILEQVAASMSAELQSAAADAMTRSEGEPARRAPLQSAEESESAVDLSSSGVGLRLMDQRKLGEILVSLSMLTPSQVESALRHQKSSGMRFGESLVELGLIKKNALEATLRIQRRQSSSRSSPPPWAS